jgi:hypothetical protein
MAAQTKQNSVFRFKHREDEREEEREEKME